ncbi:MAG: hypothetical protein R2755_13455 [Acidimicrobiales bacterium]
MAGDDQVVAGPGGGHVQQPQLLEAVHLRFEVGSGLVELGGQRLAQAQLRRAVFAPQHADPPAAAPRRRAHTAQYGDGELQALGAVHGHDPHGVLVELGQQRLVHRGTVGALQRRPVEEGPQPSPARVLERPGLVHEEAQPPPHVGGARRTEAEQEAVALAQHPAQQLGGAVPPAVEPQAAQVGEGEADRLVRRQAVRRLRAQVPATAGAPEAVQLHVGAGVQRRAERRHQRQLVARVVDGAQHGQHVADLLGVVDERAGGQPVRDGGAIERFAQVGQRGAGREQDGHIGQAGRAPPTTLLAHRPGIGPGDHVGDGGGHVGGLCPSHVGGPGGAVEVRTAEQQRPMIDAVAGLPHGPQRLVGGLAAGLLVGHQRAEQTVHPVEHGPDRAEVGVEAGQAAISAEPVAGFEEQRDVGPAEPVDRLLGVTHEEQPARFDLQRRPARRAGIGHRGGHQHGQLDLQRIGVLELVEEEVAIAAVQRLPGGGAVTQHGAGQHQQVVELQQPGGPAGIGAVEHVPGEQHQEVAQQFVGDALHDAGAGLVHGGDERAGAHHVGPVLLAALAGDVLGPRVAHGAQGLQLASRRQGGHGRRFGQQIDRGPQVQLVLRVAALLHTVGHVGHGPVEPIERQGPQRWPVTVGHRGQQVPVLVEPGGCVAQRGLAEVLGFDADADQDRTGEELLVGRIVVEGVGEALPAVLGGQLRGHLVGHRHPRRETGVDGELAEQPAGEAVQGGDGGAVGVGQGLAAPVELEQVGGGGEPALEVGADAAAQLGGGGLGERDGGDVGQGHATFEHQVGDPLHELGGLAGARTGLDEERAVEADRADQLAVHQVGWIGGTAGARVNVARAHRSPPSVAEPSGSKRCSTARPARTGRRA